MRIDRAMRLVQEEYERARKYEWVHDPVAYALYQVWKQAASESRSQDTKNHE